MNKCSFSPLIEVLQERSAACRTPKFWLRDDDAVRPSRSLDRLLSLTAEYSVPLTLAVIPAHTDDALVQVLADTEHVSVALHGWSHTNYAARTEKKQELGKHRPVSECLDTLRLGRDKLSELFGPRFLPVLVPPWNRISDEIVEQLSTLDITCLSTFGDERPSNERLGEQPTSMVIQINSHIDIIDWKGSRGGRELTDLVEQMRVELLNNRPFLGVLSHHLVHDEAAWVFLEQLFALTACNSLVDWVSINDLMATQAISLSE